MRVKYDECTVLEALNRNRLGDTDLIFVTLLFEICVSQLVKVLRVAVGFRISNPVDPSNAR